MNKIIPQLEGLREWLEEATFFQINDDKTPVMEDADPDKAAGYLSFDSDYDSIEIEPEHVKSVEWVEADYGDHYCHVLMDDEQGYEFRSFICVQRPVPASNEANAGGEL